MPEVPSDEAGGGGSSPGSRAPTSEDRATPRLWPGAAIVGAFWLLMAVLQVADLVISTNFLMMAAGCLLATVAFLAWWLTNRRIARRDRWLALAVAIAAGAIAILASRETLGAQGAIFIGLPLLMTAWIGWLLISRQATPRTRRLGLLGTIVVAWSAIAAVRVEGIDGAMMPDVHWRWTPTNEQVYLSERSLKPGAATTVSAPAAEQDPLTLELGDWPCFRGPDFLGEQEHSPIATDWNAEPPVLLWKRRVGPAWSSFVVVGDRLFTQEQRGDEEVTVCLSAATGEEIWAHLDKTRFWDGQAGAGPRGTPTFHQGKLYTYGATGLLDCLDAASGRLLWSRNVAAETQAPLPMWGFSSSPLVTAGKVIVFAGGVDDRGLVAYDAQTGTPAWHAASGPISYSTAQLVVIEGQPQVLLLTDTGVVAVDPDDGGRLWRYDASANGIWRVIQPRHLRDNRILVGSEDLGLRLLEVSRGADGWQAREEWITRDMKPAYNDCVIVDRVAYGFDKGIFCAIDLAAGKRLWKGGRYGYGQVLLLKPQNVLVILSERGEVALVAASPRKHEELGRFQAIEGKTWNHPVVVRNRLYVRNDAEMAAYALAPMADGAR